jgi:putative transposase
MSFNELRKGRHSEPGNVYFVTATTLDRQQWFAQFDLARLLIVEMKRLHDEAAVESLAWAVMPDHVHWLFSLGSALALGPVLNQLKGRSARSINRRLGRNGPFWQAAYYDHALRTDEDLKDVARYIVANPLRAGLVTSLGDYAHWDAAWLDAGFSWVGLQADACGCRPQGRPTGSRREL